MHVIVGLSFYKSNCMMATAAMILNIWTKFLVATFKLDS